MTGFGASFAAASFFSVPFSSASLSASGFFSSFAPGQLRLVALRGEGRRGGRGEEERVGARRLVHGVRRLEGAERRVEVPIGEEVEVPALGVEDRLGAVRSGRRDGDRLLRRERVEEDDAEVVLDGLHVGEPLPVGREGVAGDLEDRRGVDEDWLLLRDVDDPEAHRPVGVRELLRVARPDGREVPGVRRGGDLHRLALAVLRGDEELLLAGGVGPVRDPLSVGRPDGVALACAARPRQVPGVAVLRGDREDVAARGEDRPLSAGGRGRNR